MSTEREPEPEHGVVRDRLQEWRDAERDAKSEAPRTAARKMARKRADRAREDFHDAEDEERERQGNHRPRDRRKPRPPTDAA